MNPSDLRRDVMPTIDLQPYWDLDQIEYVQAAGSVAAVYGVSYLQVPEGEAWIPLSLKYDITGTVIGESFALGIGITNNSAAVRAMVAVNNGTQSVTAIETTAVAYAWNMRNLVPAGDRFFGQVNKFVAAGARTTALSLRFIRLKI